LGKSRLKMAVKWKAVLFDLLIVTVAAILIAALVNGLRADRIPIIPPCMDKGFYQEMKMSAFAQGEIKNSRCFIFDARPHELYQKNHLPNAVNFPVSQFDFFYHLHLAEVPLDTPILVYGRTVSQVCDRELAYRLSLKGYKNVTVIL